MKAKKKGQWGGHRTPGEKKPMPRGYAGSRDGDGLTPRQRLDTYKAELAKVELAKAKGDLVSKSEVEAGMREASEVIQSDLFGALPSRCATALGGRTVSAEDVRLAVIAAVDDMVKNWQSAEVVK